MVEFVVLTCPLLSLFISEVCVSALGLERLVVLDLVGGCHATNALYIVQTVMIHV